MARDAGPDLRGGLAQLSLLVSVEAFLGAGGTLRAVRRFIATPQAGVAERAIAAAIAR